MYGVADCERGEDAEGIAGVCVVGKRGESGGSWREFDRARF